MALPVVLFIDEVCNKPYDPNVLKNEALGGTEATVIRIAEALASTGYFNVCVEQHNREREDMYEAVYCVAGCNPRANYVISLRSPTTLAKAKKRFPDAKHYLWNHDLCTPDTAQGIVPQSGFEAVVVSQFHKTQFVETLKAQGYDGKFPVKVVYNPIDENLAPDSTPVDPHKLVFFSSPHKGLDNALQLFAHLKRIDPLFNLTLANPGYFADIDTVPSGVNLVGAIPHADAIKHVRSSLCVFYPNFVFPETFGLVFAEANAVGTPVLTHSIGAAPEILYHPHETVDCRNIKAVVERVLAWRDGDRPKVKANSKFRVSEVIKSWMRLFNANN